MLSIPSEREGLVCAVDECYGTPLGTKGWHHVSGRDQDADQWHQVIVSVFVCTEHLSEAEQAMTEHMRQEHPGCRWQVQTYRMYGWSDDGRPAAYVVAERAEVEQATLF